MKTLPLYPTDLPKNHNYGNSDLQYLVDLSAIEAVSEFLNKECHERNMVDVSLLFSNEDERIDDAYLEEMTQNCVWKLNRVQNIPFLLKVKLSKEAIERVFWKTRHDNGASSLSKRLDQFEMAIH